MTMISVILPKAFDKARFEELLKEHNTNKNALLNLFLARVVNGDIDLKTFLLTNEIQKNNIVDEIETLKTTIDNILERLAILESKEVLNDNKINQSDQCKKIADLGTSTINESKPQNKKGKQKNIYTQRDIDIVINAIKEYTTITDVLKHFDDNNITLDNGHKFSRYIIKAIQELDTNVQLTLNTAHIA